MGSRMRAGDSEKRGGAFWMSGRRIVSSGDHQGKRLSDQDQGTVRRRQGYGGRARKEARVSAFVRATARQAGVRALQPGRWQESTTDPLTEKCKE